MPSQCTPTTLLLCPLSSCLSPLPPVFLCLYLPIDLCPRPGVSYAEVDWWASVCCVKLFIRGCGDVFGVAVALLPVAEQRPVQLQVAPRPEADAAFELETSWRRLQALYDTWMNSENPGILQRKCSILEAVAFFYFNCSKFVQASAVLFLTADWIK